MANKRPDKRTRQRIAETDRVDARWPETPVTARHKKQVRRDVARRYIHVTSGHVDESAPSVQAYNWYASMTRGRKTARHNDRLADMNALEPGQRFSVSIPKTD